MAGQQFEYGFDHIGNRTATGGRASAVSTYTVNALNQYTQRTVPAVVDVLGIANPTTNVTVAMQGGTAYPAARHGEYFHHALTVGNNVHPTLEVKSLYGATQTQTSQVFNPPATESFTHDADGNLTQDGRSHLGQRPVGHAARGLSHLPVGRPLTRQPRQLTTD